MFRILTATLLTTMPALFAQSVSPVAFSSSTMSISAFSSDGIVPVDVRELAVNIKYKSGREEQGFVTVLFSPSTGFYSWIYVEGNLIEKEGFRRAFLDKSAAVYILPDEIVQFRVTSSLYVKVWKSQAGNLDEAERLAFTELERRTAQVNQLPDNQAKDIAMHLGMEFRCEPSSSFCDNSIEIRSVVHEKRQWKLVLESLKKAQVVLDDKYDLVRVDPLTP